MLQTGIELELIERLKKKQIEQQQALKELQDAMSLTSRSAWSLSSPNHAYLLSRNDTGPCLHTWAWL